MGFHLASTSLTGWINVTTSSTALRNRCEDDERHSHLGCCASGRRCAGPCCAARDQSMRPRPRAKGEDDDVCVFSQGFTTMAGRQAVQNGRHCRVRWRLLGSTLRRPRNSWGIVSTSLPHGVPQLPGHVIAALNCAIPPRNGGKWKLRPIACCNLGQEQHPPTYLRCNAYLVDGVRTQIGSFEGIICHPDGNLAATRCLH